MYHTHCAKQTYPHLTNYIKMFTFTNLSLILVKKSLLSNELANNTASNSIQYVLKFDVCRSNISFKIECPNN